MRLYTYYPFIFKLNGRQKLVPPPLSFGRGEAGRGEVSSGALSNLDEYPFPV